MLTQDMRLRKQKLLGSKELPMLQPRALVLRMLLNVLAFKPSRIVLVVQLKQLLKNREGSQLKLPQLKKQQLKKQQLKKLRGGGGLVAALV